MGREFQATEPGFKTARTVVSDRIDSDEMKLNRESCKAVSMGPCVDGELRKRVEVLWLPCARQEHRCGSWGPA